MLGANAPATPAQQAFIMYSKQEIAYDHHALLQSLDALLLGMWYTLSGIGAGAVAPCIRQYRGRLCYTSYILPRNLPGRFHVLPCYQGQECGSCVWVGGGTRNKTYTALKTVRGIRLLKLSRPVMRTERKQLVCLDSDLKLLQNLMCPGIQNILSGPTRSRPTRARNTTWVTCSTVRNSCFFNLFKRLLHLFTHLSYRREVLFG